MFDILERFLKSDRLSPHGICLTWRPELIWTHVIADAAIALSYFSIPVVLAVFVSRRRDLAFGWIFWSFAAFILACGTTHFMSIWTIWIPDYGLEALVKVVTAVVSIATAIALWFLLPKALALPSPAALRQANCALVDRIEERDAALTALDSANAERRQVEEMLRQAQKMEAIGQFTGGLAHDFNNLLNVVLGNLDRLERRLTDDEVKRRAARDAREAATRAAAVVQKLLAFARKQALLPVRANANHLVRSMMPLLQGVAIPSGIALDLRATWDICVDANQFEAAIVNLAVNGRDAMSNRGTLTLGTSNMSTSEKTADGLPEGDYVIVEVSDNGTGMTREVCNRAFEPFFTTKPVGQGTGLGLSQVFGFVTQSGGVVRVASDVGRGTRMSLVLPRATSGNAATDAPETAPMCPIKDLAAQEHAAQDFAAEDIVAGAVAR